MSLCSLAVVTPFPVGRSLHSLIACGTLSRTGGIACRNDNYNLQAP